jgi:hypothetical protein
MSRRLRVVTVAGLVSWASGEWRTAAGAAPSPDAPSTPRAPGLPPDGEAVTDRENVERVARAVSTLALLSTSPDVKNMPARRASRSRLVLRSGNADESQRDTSGYGRRRNAEKLRKNLAAAKCDAEKR